MDRADPHDPTARVIFLLIRDHVPPGVIDAAVEKARAVQKEVPDGGIGQLACELAQKVHTLVD